MTPEVNESGLDLLARARNGDEKARNEAVQANIGLVKYVARRFANRGAEYEDLFQYGCMGLLKAIDRFDPGFQVCFSTYAVPVIMGEMRRFLRDSGPIHISRTIRDQARRIEDYVKQYEQLHERAPDVGEIAVGVGLDEADVVLALNSRSPVRSLEEPVGEGDGLRLMDVLGEECIGGVDRRLTLARLLRDLPDRDRLLIVRRYLQSHTQTEIARDMGVSQVQVSRMERRIINHMRKLAGTDET